MLLDKGKGVMNSTETDYRIKKYADGFYVVRPRTTSPGMKKVSGPYNTPQIAQYAVEQHEREEQ